MNFILAARRQLVRKAKSALTSHKYVQNFEISLKHEKAFAHAVRKLWEDLITPRIEHAFTHAWLTGKTLPEIKATIPYFTRDTSDDVWLEFVDELSKAYEGAIKESGDAAMRDLGTRFGIQIKFTLLNDRVSKATAQEKAEFREQVALPINPYSVIWMKKRSLNLIRESFTSEQKSVVGKILQDSFNKGIRATSVIENIRSNIGLTRQGFDAVERVRETWTEAQLPTARIDTLVETYRDKLLNQRAMTIARTETAYAVSEGRREAWMMAKNEGELPKNVIRTWISAPESIRLCPECQESDGTTAAIDEQYDNGSDGPPLHPNCRCLEILSEESE